MKITTTLLYLLLGLMTGCIALQDSAVMSNADNADRIDPDAPSPTYYQDGPASDTAAPTRLSPTELALWRSPAFQEEFARSYLSETEIEPRVTIDERDKMQEVLKLFQENKLDEAAALIKAYFEKNSNVAVSAVFDFTLGNIYFQQEKFDLAVEAYRMAVSPQKHPKFRRAWQNLGLIYVRQGKYAQAIEAFGRVLELSGGSGTTYGLLGYSYSNLENHLAAESAYRMAILLQPENKDWKMGLARSFFKQERFAAAAAFCGQLLAKEPDRTDLWLLQANAYLGLKQPLRAAENYELVDRMGASTVASLNMLGDIYVNEELYGLAVRSYIRAMEKDPKAKPDRALRAAKVLIARGAMDETDLLIERIKAIYGQHLNNDHRKDLLKMQARLAVARGSGDEQAQVLERIVEIDPLDGEALILLGQHYGRKGDIDRAINYYERAEDLEGFEADAMVRHAQLLVRTGKYADALPLLRSAQQKNPRENVQEYLEQVERIAKSG